MSCAAVGLTLDQFDLVVDAFGAAVVPGQGQSGIDGRAVAIESGGVGGEEGKVRCPDSGDPAGQRRSVVGRRSEHRGELTHGAGQGSHLRAGRGELVAQYLLVLSQVSGVGGQEAGDAARGGVPGGVDILTMDLVDPRKGGQVGRKSPYPEEFRSDAVALCRAAGGKRTYAAVAADVGVTGETLRSWVRQADETCGPRSRARRAGRGRQG